MTRLVSELTGADLALWVARAEGLDAEVRSYEMADGRHYYCNVRTPTRNYPFSPHEDWAQGGLLINKHEAGFRRVDHAEWLAVEHVSPSASTSPSRTTTVCWRRWSSPTTQSA